MTCATRRRSRTSRWGRMSSTRWRATSRASSTMSGASRRSISPTCPHLARARPRERVRRGRPARAVAPRAAARAGTGAHGGRLPRPSDRRLMTGLDVDRTSAREIARLLDARELSCEDVASAYLSRLEALNGDLNVILQSTTSAPSLGAGARGRAQRHRGRAHRLQGRAPHPRRADHGGLARVEGYRPPYDADRRAPLRGRGPRRARQDQHGRVRDGLVERELRLRPDAEPLGSRARPGGSCGGSRPRSRRRCAARRSAPTPAARSGSRPRSAASWA